MFAALVREGSVAAKVCAHTLKILRIITLGKWLIPYSAEHYLDFLWGFLLGKFKEVLLNAFYFSYLGDLLVLD